MRMGFDRQDCAHISVAAREAVRNAAVHAHRLDPEKRVTVALESTPDRLTICVSDEGAGFNPDTLPDPLAPENLLKDSGRGIFLIRAFMDEVSFASGSSGSEICMTKFVRGPGRNANYPSKEPIK